jgi:uncharacterized protein (TIGR02687 family)
MNLIQGTLIQLFKRHRIVFWYDTKCELRGEFETLILPGVELIELSNNEFAVKHRTLREQPGQKFLLYQEGPKPPDLDNWLLDVELAQGEFRADQAALWLAELGLGAEFADLVQVQAGFFTSAERRAALKVLVQSDETLESARMKMLGIAVVCDPRLDEVVESLLAELAAGGAQKAELLEACGLDEFLWERVARAFGYRSGSPGVQDFAIRLFKSCYAMELGQPDPGNTLKPDALVFLKRWKDSLRHHAAFETISNQCAEILNIKTDLAGRELRSLVEMDLFRVIDQKLIVDLIKGVAGRTLAPEVVESLLRQRRRGHWYKDFAGVYEAIDAGSRFLAALDQANLEMNSLAEGVQRYARTWYVLDQLYRRTIYHLRKSGQVTVLEPLVQRVENLYVNQFLLRLNNQWQAVVDASPRWDASPVSPQRGFFEGWVRPFLLNKKKVYVIISDALRYEAAEELLGMVRREDGYEAQIEPLLSALPSYTQLGMAALLPNRDLRLAENESGVVLVDGTSSQGTPNRDRILKQALGESAGRQGLAVQAEEVMATTRDALREMLRENDVVYIYHNHIDAVGDKRESEERTFEAVAETLAELLALIKKLIAGNATNLLVTADHGFLYQNQPVDESDFSTAEIRGQEVFFQERRFAFGRGLAEHPGLRKFTSAEAGLEGNVEIQVPKVVARLRQRGSGSRYVHGGAALQEVVVPVLQINKKRESDVTQVQVDILRGSGNLITSGQQTVSFYQVEPVSEKVQARRLRAGIFTQSGELISDSHELIFDIESDNPRQREVPVRFLLTQAANQANNQEVILKLEEQVANTSYFQEYKSVRYTIRRSFTSDFDF